MRVCRIGRPLLTLAIGGCLTVGPKHQVPSVAVPTSWSRAGSAPADVRALAHWWTTFGDPQLTDLVARAIQRNLDLRRARARVREARAQRESAESNLYPTINATGTEVRNATQNASTKSYSLAFDASWEVDLWGGLRREVEAATATEQARIEDLHDVLVTLVSEVALSYIDARVATARLQTATKNLRTQQETYEITSFRYQAGLATEVDVAQARRQLEQTRAAIPNVRTTRQQAQNRLAVLLGVPPGALDHELAAERPIPVAPITIAIGVPADLLRRRPDVRRAERELAAQTAQVGVAEAQKYPALHLSGTIGLESLALGNLFSGNSVVSSAIASLTQPVFNAGRIRANIDIETARQEQAAITYEASVLTALEDVENALVSYAEEQARHDALVKSVEAAQTATNLANTRYRNGLIDFQVVLDAQRAQLLVEDELVTSQGLLASDLVRLYKAVGGGWTPPTRGGR